MPKEISRVVPAGNGTSHEADALEDKARVEATDNQETKVETSEDDDMESSSEPPVFDDMETEPLTFVEMHAYLVTQLQGISNKEAKNVESASAFMQQLIQEVFTSHASDWIQPGRRRCLELNDIEMQKMFDLFLIDAQENQADARKWRARLQTLTRTIYKSHGSMCETLDVSVKSVQARPGPAVNPWSQRLFTNPAQEDEDVDIPKGLTRGHLGGTILCHKLPDFLKRVCTNEAYRKIQDTIKAQVEGDLILQLYQVFRVYPQFQSLLKEAKQICYDRGQHAIHLIFWTREMADKQNKLCTTCTMQLNPSVSKKPPRVKHSHALQYGLLFVAKDVRGAVLCVQCQFCQYFGREMDVDGKKESGPELSNIQTSLSRAAEMQLRHIHVAGNSALIIDQMRHRKSPKAPHLRTAEQLANIAMDERVNRQIFKSDQVEHIPPWDNVLRIASGDMEHWKDAYLETGSGMPDFSGEYYTNDRKSNFTN
ncbi:hypothetical protein PHMEG_0003009 [Phytophthora megakarya]|uniref:RNase H type-1 domain-containing protein n=1 Tax=Phytophthora megakarya TaxID=4795 RepID=A0A225WXF2_9STRA|nr:hypothetical protein PHMEG_0003009 [Phytophthora megakarya]